MKKHLILTLNCLIFLSIQIKAQDTNNLLKSDCNVRNLTLSSPSEDNALASYILSDEIIGIVDLHPFSAEDIGGWDVFEYSLTESQDYSYEFVGESQSRLFGGTHHRYKQLYKGVPIVDAGFSVYTNNNDPQAAVGPPCEGCPVGPTGGPCDLIYSFAPRIYENVDISVNPLILRNQAVNRLQEPDIMLHGANLQIANNSTGNCEYKLLWNISYSTPSSSNMIAWVDAHDGTVILNKSLNNDKMAPTADHGQQNMIDEEDGDNTVLRNDRMRAYDMSGINTVNGNPVTRTNQLGNEFDDDDIPESPSTRNWLAADASTEIFQAFWMTEQVLETFLVDFEIEFEDARIGIHPTAVGATSFGPDTPDGRSRYVFGQINGNSTVELDVIGHELAHTILREFISSAQIEGGSLHEAISDMFGTYIESVLSPGGLDWVMGDDIPFTVRDLQNTTRNCFNNALTIPHDRGEALGHWFFLLCNGDPANGIDPINMKDVLDMVYETLPNLGDNPDYEDLMQAIRGVARNKYGTCSDEYESIMRAWDQICIPTGTNYSAPCTDLWTSSTLVCEENNRITVCVSSGSGLNFNGGRWNILGRNSTSFKSVRGMSGNGQNGGQCLDIYEIPDMPYYPQKITIKYWHPVLGVTLSKTITIRDCDGDDPTCEEYYGLDGIGPDPDNMRMQANEEASSISERQLIVYDLMGNKLDITEEEIINGFNRTPQIIIVTYWDKLGNLIESKKVLLK